MAGLIDQIEAGGGGLDVLNPKYISFTPNQSFRTYDIMEDTGYSNTIHVTVDLTNYDDDTGYEPYCYFTASALDFGGGYPFEELHKKQSNQFDVTFKGTMVRPTFFLCVFDGNRNLVDIAKVDVYA